MTVGKRTSKTARASRGTAYAPSFVWGMTINHYLTRKSGESGQKLVFHLETPQERPFAYMLLMSKPTPVPPPSRKLTDDET